MSALLNETASADLEQRVARAKTLLATIARDYAPAAFANSFGAEDMVLTDLIAKDFPEIEMFSLDTGRLPEETYRLMQQVAERYRINTRVYFPEAQAVESYVREHGPNAFYGSVALRKQCCAMRKVEPLRRALAGKKAWITGLRRAQAVTRTDLAESEFDRDHGLQKFSPLADWSERDVWAYINEHEVPYNALHDRGYPSIGCAPCTRAITPGGDIRAGRWWWENSDARECGLHPHGGAVSAAANASKARVKDALHPAEAKTGARECGLHPHGGAVSAAANASKARVKDALHPAEAKMPNKECGLHPRKAA